MEPGETISQKPADKVASSRQDIFAGKLLYFIPSDIKSIDVFHSNFFNISLLLKAPKLYMINFQIHELLRINLSSC